MKRRTGAWSVWVVLACVLLLAGCTGSDALKSGNARVRIVMDPGTNDTHFEEYIFQVSRLLVEPLDPQAQEAIGANDLGVLGARTVIVDFNNPFDQISDTALPAGTYRVVLLRVADIVMYSEDLPANPQVCEDYIVESFIIDPPFSGGGVNLSSFSGTTEFTVDDTTGGEVQVHIDAAALKEAVYAGLGCGSCTPSNCFVTQPMNPSCRCRQTGSFQNIALINGSPSFLTVN